MTATLTPPEVSMLVRPATERDLPVILHVLSTVGLATTSVNMTDSTYWIALLSGRPVGVIGLERAENASLLRSAAVLPEARALGVGRALVQSALTLATLRGDQAVYLFSRDAGAYWQRYGFQEVPVATLTQALANTSQVRSGVTRGWITEEVAWRKTLEFPA